MRKAFVRVTIGLFSGMTAVTAVAAFHSWETVPAAWLLSLFTLPSLVLHEWIRKKHNRRAANSVYATSLVPFSGMIAYGLFSPEGHHMAVFCLWMYAICTAVGYATMRRLNNRPSDTASRNPDHHVFTPHRSPQ